MWFVSGLAFLSAIFIVSCQKENTNLGLNIQPPNDKLNVVYTDTTTVVAYSQLVDSVRTDETTYSLLGSIQDPVFGKSTASFCTEFVLSKTSYSFGDNPVADSLILSLCYYSYYGDTLSPLTVKVYEMAQHIYPDSAYYSNQPIDVKETLLAQKTFIPDYRDSVVVGTDTLVPHLRLNLGQFTNELIDKLLYAPEDSMSTNASFQNYFYGLYATVEPVNGGGQVIYFNLLNNISRMMLYYHNDTKDSLGFGYSITSGCGRFGHFDHDYSMADATFKAQVLDGDTALGAQSCYVQALAGVKTFIRFPNIRNYYDDGPIAVNEARLFMYDSETDPVLSPASALVLVEKTDTTGAYDFLPDMNQGTDYFGGYYSEDDNGYWFRITISVQNLMRSTDPDYGLELYLSGGAVNAQRSILTGTAPQAPASPDNRMKLVLTYTKLL